LSAVSRFRQADVRLRTRDGNDYVTELKFFKAAIKDKGGKDKVLTDEQIQEDMEKALTTAMVKTEKNKYTLKFQGQGNKIYKAALAVSGRAGVRVALKRRQIGLWRRIPDSLTIRSGRFELKTIGDEAAEYSAAVSEIKNSGLTAL
jgi:hypothetical protein